MPDISKIRLSEDIEYQIKDTELRKAIETLIGNHKDKVFNTTQDLNKVSE